MTIATILLIAMILDAVLGEPDWLWSRLPHPAVLMGRVIGWLDQRFNQGPARKVKGTVAFAALCGAVLTLGVLIFVLPGGWIIETLLTAFLLAQRSLSDHVRTVADALRLSIGDGRLAVAQIVGRDTTDMQEPAIARAAIESAAENLSDGVIAPAFWFLVAGLPGLLLYKVTNTADSMIGYRTDQHRDFGWAAARFDDLLNWVPARLTAALIAVTHVRWDAHSLIRRDAKLHRSPNAGWPEAAIAVVLNVALSGPRSYGGVPQDFPYVHPEGRTTATVDDIDAAVTALWRTWAGAVAIVILITVV